MTDIRYYGWIQGCVTDREHLESLGIKLGTYDDIDGTYDDCECDGVALSELGKYHDRYSWDMVRRVIV